MPYNADFLSKYYNADGTPDFLGDGRRYYANRSLPAN